MFSPIISEGLNLDRLPATTRRDLFRAARDLGWTPAHWTSKKNVRVVAEAAKALRDDGRAVGADGLDKVWHELTAWVEGKGIPHAAPTLPRVPSDIEVVVVRSRPEAQEPGSCSFADLQEGKSPTLPCPKKLALP